MAYRKETTALAVDNKARRAIARVWNGSRTIEGWPQQGLIEPPLKAKEGPRWEDFPQQLQAEQERCLALVSLEEYLHELKDFKVKTYESTSVTGNCIVATSFSRNSPAEPGPHR